MAVLVTAISTLQSQYRNLLHSDTFVHFDLIHFSHIEFIFFYHNVNFCFICNSNMQPPSSPFISPNPPLPTRLHFITSFVKEEALYPTTILRLATTYAPYDNIAMRSKGVYKCFTAEHYYIRSVLFHKPCYSEINIYLNTAGETLT